MPAESLYKLIKYINKNKDFFLWTDREENICLGFKKERIVDELSNDRLILRKANII